MDGYETAKLIRERSADERTPIIFVSAFGRDDMQTSAAYASGAVDFIFTPILPDVLRAKVSALVGLFLQAQELQRSVESVTALNIALRDSEVRARAVLQNVARRDRHGRRGRADRVVQPLRPAAVRLQRGGGDRPPAGADRRAEPPRRLRRVRACALGADARRRRPPAEPIETHGLPEGRLVLSDGDRAEPDADRRRARSRSAACATSRVARRTPRRSSTARSTTSSPGSRTGRCSADRIDRRSRRPSALPSRAACSCSTSTASAQSTSS